MIGEILDIFKIVSNLVPRESRVWLVIGIIFGFLIGFVSAPSLYEFYYKPQISSYRIDNELLLEYRHKSEKEISELNEKIIDLERSKRTLATSNKKDSEIAAPQRPSIQEKYRLNDGDDSKSKPKNISSRNQSCEKSNPSGFFDIEIGEVVKPLTGKCSQCYIELRSVSGKSNYGGDIINVSINGIEDSVIDGIPFQLNCNGATYSFSIINYGERASIIYR